MKKKTLSALMLVTAISMVPTFALARGSVSYRDDSNSGSGSGSSSTSSTTDTSKPNPDSPAGTTEPQKSTNVEVRSDGTMVTTTGATSDKSGTTIGLAVNMTATDGSTIAANGDGSVNNGNVNVKFVSGTAETAGLPEQIVSQINDLNSGKTASEVFGSSLGVDLSGWNLVGNTRAVVATDLTTGLTNTGTEIFLNVSSMGDAGAYAVVYYNNATGRWYMADLTVDPATGLVKVNVPGSCTVQFLKKS